MTTTTPEIDRDKVPAARLAAYDDHLRSGGTESLREFLIRSQAISISLYYENSPDPCSGDIARATTQVDEMFAFDSPTPVPAHEEG